MNNLDKLIEELDSKIPEQALIDPLISKSSVGWHIEHCLLTLNLIIRALENSEPAGYKWAFNFKRSFVFTLKKIPRGRVQSPTSVQPKNIFNSDTLKAHIHISKEKLKAFYVLKPDNYFEHPFFGKLNLRPTGKFLEIHTRHHLNIINDIIKSKLITVE